MADKHYYCKLRLSYKGSFDALSDAKAAALIRAILHYATGDDSIEIPSEVAPTWAIIQADLDRDKADVENGRKGGRTKNIIQPDEDAIRDIPAYNQAIKYGFDEKDADIIARLKNSIYYGQFVYKAMEVCYNNDRKDYAYFNGVLRNMAS